VTPRKQPVQPLGERGPTFYDLRPGDRVQVTGSGRTGTIVRRCTHKRDGWLVRWDEPVFGVEEGRVAWANLAPAS
jgi:hypothetical protein